MVKRKNFISKYTYNILNNFPSWMKINNPDSNGFPLINSFGQELDLLNSQFNENFNDLFIKTSNLAQVDNLYFVDSRDYFNKTQITATGKYSNIKINVVNNQFDFFNARPTRIDFVQTHILSGIISGIYNLNYFYNFNSGYYYAICDITPIHPSSVITYGDNFKKLLYTSYSSGRMDYNHEGAYELIEPASSGKLISLYPLYRMIYSGLVDNPILTYKYEPHYIPQASSGWNNTWYYDSNGNLNYHFTRLNNPFGSGRYNLSNSELKYTPIENTIRIYDVLNLDSSGNPVEIPSSGKNIYKYSDGNFTYIGYESTVPKNYSVGGESATFQHTVSWFQGRTSGFLDNDIPPHSGSFQYIHGTGELTNTIWFYNARSKYLVEYDYSKFDHLNDITTDNRYNNNFDLMPANSIILNEETNYNGTEIPWEFAKSSISGIRVDPDYIRPGREATVSITLIDKYSKDWLIPSGTQFYLNLYRKNLGYTQELVDKKYVEKGLL